ncbi:MAG: helix-turn-helix domain-containing protein [Propionibacteriales bacterium]|nr:helix-turn-helix domain-containing protein [Propionibacteriales bacterium]
MAECSDGRTEGVIERSRPVVLVREVLGEVLREQRVRQGRTLRDVSKNAKVSLGYISEVERGVKEASSECLAAICSALGVPLSAVLDLVSQELSRQESAVTTLPSVDASLDVRDVVAAA